MGCPEFWGPTDGNVVEPRMAASFVPEHKAPMVLFLDRVYGVQSQEFLLHVLEVGFLPDMRAAASLDTVRGTPKPPRAPQNSLLGPLSLCRVIPVSSCGVGLGTPKYSLWDWFGIPQIFPVGWV